MACALLHVFISNFYFTQIYPNLIYIYTIFHKWSILEKTNQDVSFSLFHSFFLFLPTHTILILKNRYNNSFILLFFFSYKHKSKKFNKNKTCDYKLVFITTFTETFNNISTFSRIIVLKNTYNNHLLTNLFISIKNHRVFKKDKMKQLKEKDTFVFLKFLFFSCY